MPVLRYLLLSVVAVHFVFAEITFFTHPLRPFSFFDGKNQFSGMAVELVRAMMEKRGEVGEITDVSFKRGLQLVQMTDSKALFIAMRTESRENTVKWVGPLFSNGVYVYVKKGSDLQIRTLDDLRKLKAVGVGSGNTDHVFLQDEGFENLVVTYQQENCLWRLHNRKIDATPMGEMVFSETVKSYGMEPDAFEKTELKLYDSNLYLIFSKNISDEEVTAWQSALEELKSEGTYDAIIKKYMDE